MAEGVRELPGVCFIRPLIPFSSVPPLRTIHLQRPTSKYTLGLRSSVQVFVRHRHSVDRTTEHCQWLRSRLSFAYWSFQELKAPGSWHRCQSLVINNCWVWGNGRQAPSSLVETTLTPSRGLLWDWLSSTHWSQRLLTKISFLLVFHLFLVLLSCYLIPFINLSPTNPHLRVYFWGILLNETKTVWLFNNIFDILLPKITSGNYLRYFNLNSYSLLIYTSSELQVSIHKAN